MFLCYWKHIISNNSVYHCIHWIHTSMITGLDECNCFLSWGLLYIHKAYLKNNTYVKREVKIIWDLGWNNSHMLLWTSSPTLHGCPNSVGGEIPFSLWSHLLTTTPSHEMTNELKFLDVLIILSVEPSNLWNSHEDWLIHNLPNGYYGFRICPCHMNLGNLTKCISETT